MKNTNIVCPCCGQVDDVAVETRYDEERVFLDGVLFENWDLTCRACGKSFKREVGYSIQLLDVVKTRYEEYMYETGN